MRFRLKNKIFPEMYQLRYLNSVHDVKLVKLWCAKIADRDRQ